MNRALLIWIAAAVGWTATPVVAAPVRSAGLLARAPEVTEVQGKEFYVPVPEGSAPYRDLEVFLVARQVADPLRKGWYDFEFVGRAAVAETVEGKAHLVLYKAFQGSELRAGDRLMRTGDPVTVDEMEALRKEVIGVLNRDKELEDLYTGLISVKLGLYQGSLDSTSSNDTNLYKRSNSYFLSNLGIRWWFFFNPAVGLNLELARGGIPTQGTFGQDEESSQTYFNPGLLYRSRFFSLPAIYSATYFFNKFSTSNPDDFLIGSSYSGINLGMTLYFPYRLQLLRLGPFTFSFNNLEVGGGYAPLVSVSDTNYSRGDKVSARQWSINAGVEFNLAIRGLRFTNDLFIVVEGGRQNYDLTFSGVTEGTLPSGALIPENGVHTETQTWYGVRLKYNMRDYIGELLLGL